MTDQDSYRNYIAIRKVLGGYSLGELEAAILDVVWDSEPPVSSTQVFKAMYPGRELTYSTVTLTMAKLAEKGILHRKRMGNKLRSPFVYTPRVSRREMALSLLDQVARAIIHKPLKEAIADLCGAEDPSCADLTRLAPPKASPR